MGKMLGATIEKEDPGVYASVEKLPAGRALMVAHDEATASKAFGEMVEDAKCYEARRLRCSTRHYSLPFIGCLLLERLL